MRGQSTDNEKEALVYALIEKRLEQQLDSVKNLDTKGSITLAVAGVLCSGIIQYLSELQVDGQYKIAAFLSLTVLVLAGVFAVLVFIQLGRNGYKDDWRNDPDPGKLLGASSNYDRDHLLRLIMDTMVRSYDHNRLQYRKRYRYLYFSWSAIGTAVILLMVGLYGGN